jgi:hypothetical protein
MSDRVLIKKDFDMNPYTKRSAFESFYENKIYIVTVLLANNMQALENIEDPSDQKNIFKGRIKRINQLIYNGFRLKIVLYSFQKKYLFLAEISPLKKTDLLNVLELKIKIS